MLLPAAVRRRYAISSPPFAFRRAAILFRATALHDFALPRDAAMPELPLMFIEVIAELIMPTPRRARHARRAMSALVLR